MNTVLDLELDHHFTGSLEAAAEAASVQAANTGAAVLTVQAIELETHKATFIGTLPDGAVAASTSLGVSAPRVRSLYTTWGSMLRPSGTIGFLVVSQPVVCHPYEAEDPHLCRVAISVPRALETISPSTLGPVCCVRCRRPIATERIKAMPGARTCVTCQRQREENQNEIR